MSYFENPKVAKPVNNVAPVLEKPPDLILQSSSSSTKDGEDLKEETKIEDENVKSVWCSFGDIIRKPARLNSTSTKLASIPKQPEGASSKQYSDPDLDQLIAEDESVRDYLADKKQSKLSDFIRFR